MAISRVPGYSLLANLDRQGTDLSLTSSGVTLQYWDVTNYRIGINTTTPSQALTVNGNVLLSNGHIYTGANLQFDFGGITNYWRVGYFGNVFGTLQTNDQPNITTVGNIINLNVVGNLTVGGQTITNTTGNLNASNNQIIHVGSPIQSTDAATKGYVDLANSIQSSQIISANLGIVGYIDQANSIQSQQITSANLGIIGYIDQANTIQSGQIGAANLAIIEANVGMKGYVDNLSLNIGNLILGNITFNGNTISSSQTDGNIMISAPGTGIVQFVGQDAIGLPSGNINTRPSSPYTGYIRFNTEISDIEYWDGTEWTTPAAGVVSSDTINPDGTSNVYVLSSNSSTLGVMVSINGTLQQPFTSYTIVNNNQIQFTEIPLTTDIIEVRHIVLGTTTQLTSFLIKGTTKVELDASNVNVTGNLLPSANVTYDLGSPTLRWRTGYFSANTIDIGGGTIGLHDTLGFTFTTPGSEPQFMMPNGASTSNTFTSSTVTIQGNLAVGGNISAVGNVSGQYILGSAQFLTGLPVGYSNVNTKAYTESMGFANYSNVNVAAYITSYTGNVGGTLSNASQPFVTALGTINTGIWQASPIGTAYGGTGATTTSGVGGALDNLLPSGEQTGYVLSTSGAGSYSWVAPTAGGTTVGQQLTTTRQSNAIVSNTRIINLSGISYTPGAGQLRVYINGVRQFPAAYTETSNVSYTLDANVVSGDTVFTEIDQFSSFNNYANLTYASNVGNIAAAGLTVQSAIESLENNKAPLTSPVFSGVTTTNGNLVVNGNLFINGNLTTINANNLNINDSLIFLADFNPADTLDIGIVSSFTDAVRYQHTGFARDATDGTWKLFANVVPEPTTTINFTNATYSNLLVGNLQTIGLINVGGNLLATNITGTIVTANQPNITGVGNVTSGTWNANTIAPNRGGTGLTASGNNGNVLTSNGSTWVSQKPFTWNVTYVTVTVAENGTYTLPADCIQVNGYVASGWGLNTGSLAKIDIRNAANAILNTVFAGLTSGNDGGAGATFYYPVSLPISADANNIRMTRSSGGQASTLYITSYVTR